MLMPPLSRRRLAAALLVLLLPAAAWAGDAGQDAAAFVRIAGAQLAAAITGAASAEDKQARLSAYLDRTVDEDGVARFCLGRYWMLATEAQRTDYTSLFRRILLIGVINQLGSYQAAKTDIVISSPIVRPEGTMVPTIVEREGNGPVRITWLVTTGSGGMRIADVVAEGMSLRQTQRSDFAAFLSRNGGSIDALIAAMRQRAEAH